MSSESIVFDQKLVDQFTPMIHKLINKEVQGYQTSDVCYEFEDLFQECLIHLNTAVNKFDESLGMKFSSYAFMTISSRLGSFRNKMSKRMHKTKNFTEMNAWALVGCEIEDEALAYSSKTTLPSNYSLDIASFEHVESLVEAQNLLENLKGDRKRIYESFFIMGKTIKEICEENPHIKYNKITRDLRHLKNTYETLVEGKVPCLQ